jgi:hypothetical protein
LNDGLGEKSGLGGSWTWWKSGDSESEGSGTWWKSAKSVKISHTIITWVLISQAPAGMQEKNFICMTNFKNRHLKMMNEKRSWTWWKSEDDESRKIKNLMKISHTIIIWVPISQAPDDMQEKSLICMKNFENDSLIERVENLMKIMNREIVNLWKSDDLNRIIEKASTIEDFWERTTHIRAKFII